MAASPSLLTTDEEQRSRIQNRLHRAGIPTAIYYPKPLHLQVVFKSLGYQSGDFPVSEDFAKWVFSLPMQPYLSACELQRVVHHMTDTSA